MNQNQEDEPKEQQGVDKGEELRREGEKGPKKEEPSAPEPSTPGVAEEEAGAAEVASSPKERRKRRRMRVALLRKNYEALKEKAALSDERYERLLRLQADFENARKRMAKEKQEFIKYANEDLICHFLPVVDNFERALAHAEASQNTKSILEGVKLIQKQMSEVLANYGLRQIPSVGEKFDPNVHEAIMKVESDLHPEDTVIEEVQKGYTLNERLIRPAAVKVAVKKKAEVTKPEAKEEERKVEKPEEEAKDG